MTKLYVYSGAELQADHSDHRVREDEDPGLAGKESASGTAGEGGASGAADKGTHPADGKAPVAADLNEGDNAEDEDDDEEDNEEEVQNLTYYRLPCLQ